MMKRTTRVFGCCLFLLAAGFGMLATAAPASAEQRTDYGRTYVDQINALRSSLGISSLTFDPELTELAHQHDLVMASQKRLHHAANLGTGVTSDWRKLGENVGTGNAHADMFNAFVRSPGHYSNIVDPEFTHVGVASDVIDGYEWTTQRFMKVAPPAPPAPKYIAPPVQAPAPVQAPIIVQAPAAPAAPRAAAPAPAPVAPVTMTPATTAPSTTAAPTTAAPVPTTTEAAPVAPSSDATTAPNDDATDSNTPEAGGAIASIGADQMDPGLSIDGADVDTAPVETITTSPIASVGSPAGDDGLPTATKVAFGSAFVLSCFLLLLISRELKDRTAA